MSNQQHTKEPWGYDGHSGIGAINSDQFNGGYFTAEVMGPDKEANARRIVACVNACAGLENDQLDKVVKNPLSSYRELMQQRDELLAAQQPGACNWTYDNDDGCWNGSCGIAFCIAEETPAKNDMNYCPKCGRKLVESGKPKLDGDGWIKWYGGERPVDETARIEAVLRDKMVTEDVAGAYRWNHSNYLGDIIAYRVKP